MLLPIQKNSSTTRDSEGCCRSQRAPSLARSLSSSRKKAPLTRGPGLSPVAAAAERIRTEPNGGKLLFLDVLMFLKISCQDPSPVIAAEQKLLGPEDRSFSHGPNEPEKMKPRGSMVCSFTAASSEEPEHEQRRELQSHRPSPCQAFT